MAPVVSKEPPKTRDQKIEQAVQRARPWVESVFDVLKDFNMMGGMCMKDADWLFGRIREKLDAACVSGVRLLEGLCCLDLNSFTKGPEKPLTGSLPILFVLLLVVMLYNAFVFGYMPAAGISLNSSTSLTFHAWIFLLLANFAQAVNTDPGSCPKTKKWMTFGSPPKEAHERKKGSDDARWCRKSNAYKPDRAHFCRVLGKGVLKMDHYCPWLGNTVGFYNQKFFFLFLLYTNAACAQLGISFMQLLMNYTLPALTTFCLSGATGLAGLISSLLVPFFLFHFWLIARNTTTIEFCEKLRDGREDGKTEGTSPVNYNMGIFENFRSVLGEDPLFWLLPVGGPMGDGIRWQRSGDDQQPFSRAASTTSGTSDGEKAHKNSEKVKQKGAPSVSDNDDSANPEATHPVASGDTEGEADDTEATEKMKKTSDSPRESTADLNEALSAEDEGAEEVEEEEQSEADDIVSEAAVSDGGANDFLVWKDSAEFIEDLTIGFQFLAEKTEDCGRGSFQIGRSSLLCVLSACVPSAFSRSRTKGLQHIYQPSKISLTSTRVFPKREKETNIPAVKVVQADQPKAAESDGESCSSGFSVAD